MICFMLTMPNVIHDGIAIVLTNFRHNQPAGPKLCSHNMYYFPSETILVNI